jgi:hypothetical protein
MLMNPVMLPPGCGRLEIKPLPTGSETKMKTTGIEPVARFMAAVTGVECASSTSGRSAISSRTSVSIRSS